jgi:energy-converting hydrogenase Eha subunit C
LRIAFFRVGFLEGYNSCNYADIAAAAAKFS